MPFGILDVVGGLLTINLDNGPENSSFRTQFMQRMVDFADRTGLEIVLVYYPPYHSKYNPIERCWGILERHWNGTLIASATTALEWAATMTWKGLRPVVHLLERTYDKGVRVAKKAFRSIAERLQRDAALPKYSVRICPATIIAHVATESLNAHRARFHGQRCSRTRP